MNSQKHLLRSQLLVCLCLLTAVAIILFTASAPAQTAFLERWQTHFHSAPPTRWNGRSAGVEDAFCPISIASAPVSKAWSASPTLLWQGSITKMEIWATAGSEPLWTYPPPAASKTAQPNSDTRTLYSATLPFSLQPNQTYEWQIYQQSRTEPIKIDLQRLDDPDRDRVTQALLSETAGLTGEAAALKRADYLASQQLWFDFWQELLSIESPSAPVSALIAATVQAVCPVAN